jgi:Domain of unknown function (DUF4384)
MKFVHQFTVLLLFVFISIAPLSLLGDTPFKSEISAVRALIEELSDNLEKDNLNVTISTLTLEKSEISSQFAESLLTLIQGEMSHPDHSEDFVAVKRQALTRGATRSRGGLIREEKTEVPGQTNVILSGDYRESPDKSIVYVTLRLEEDNGSRVSEAEIALNRSAIRLPIEPENKTKIEAISDDIDGLSTPNKDFRIDLWIDRGNGGVYRSGEELRVMFKTDLECYLRVIYIDVEGNRILMYPTERDSQERLRAGTVYDLHQNNKYTIQPPFGSEMIIAFASTTRFSDDGLVDVGGGYRAFSEDHSTAKIVKNMRGIKIANKTGTVAVKPQKSEARVMITTMP